MANFGSIVSSVTVTGTGAPVLSNSPTFITPALGTPVSGIATNLTGTASGLTSGNVTTNANLTGAVTSSGNATSLGSFSSSNLSTALSDKTGTGITVFSTSPTLTTAALGSSTATTQTPSDNSTKIATTAYVDSAVLGQNFKEACKYASIAVLPSIVYANGSSGVGATLTGVALAAISLDSSSPSVNDRVLIKNQTSSFQNGIYTVTATGSGIAVFVLTRSLDANQTGEFKTGDSVFITAGATLASTTWAYTGVDSPVIGTDSITYVQSAGQGSFTSGNGITITGNSIAIDTSVTIDKTTIQTLTNKTLASPVLTAPALGTPASGIATNLTGTAAGLTAGTVTTNANLTGDVTSVGNASTLAAVNSNVGTFGSATQASVVTVNAKGLVTAASNTTVTPAIGSVTGFGTGVATALAVNVGTSGAFVTNGGALGTPSSGTMTNVTGVPAAAVLSGTFGTGSYTIDTRLTIPQILNSDNAIAASANAATVTRANRNNVVTNNSAAGITITLSTTGAAAGDMVLVQSLPSSNVAQTITWINTEISDVTPSANLNASTTSPRTDGFKWNALTSKWRCLASA